MTLEFVPYVKGCEAELCKNENKRYLVKVKKHSIDFLAFYVGSPMNSDSFTWILGSYFSFDLGEIIEYAELPDLQ